MNAIVNMGAQEVIRAIRAGEVSAEDYVAALLRQERKFKYLNAFITVDSDQVLEQARIVDTQRSRGRVLGRAAGLPLCVKDQISVAGMPATCGSAPLKKYIPTQSATVIEALRREGAIIFGKTNMPDMVVGNSLAVGEASVNPYFGTPRNPYDPRCIAGGTSGGNAVAIAARMVPAGIGEDTGGSIRLPAACCGIAGLRPSTFTIHNALFKSNHKRYPDDGAVVALPWALDTWGPMARTVSDVAFLDEIITGERSADLEVSEIRIGVPREDYWRQEFIDSRVAESITAAINRLREKGADLIEIDFNAVRLLSDNEHFLATMALPPKPDLGKWLADNVPTVSLNEIYEIYEESGYPPVEDWPVIDMDEQERARILTEGASRYAEVFRSNNISAIVSPMLTITAPALDPVAERIDKMISINERLIDQTSTLARNLLWGPLLGAPGLSIPVALVGGMPASIELAGQPGDDRRILAIGAAIERAMGPVPPPDLLELC